MPTHVPVWRTSTNLASRLLMSTIAGSLLIAVSPAPVSADDSPVARARQWYLKEISKSEQACQLATRKVEESQRLLDKAQAIERKAPPDDVAGRSVAQQAAAKARLAIAKNSARQERECSRLSHLREGLGNVELTKGAAAMPVVVKGEITLVTAQGEVPWDGRTPLQSGQKLSTGKDGYAEVALPGTRYQVRLDADSTLTVLEDGVSLERGRFYYLKDAAQEMAEETFGKLVRVTSPKVVIAVRGTRFVTTLPPAERADITVLEGEVVLSQPGTKRETVVRAGHRVPLSDKGFGEPIPFDPVSLVPWWEKE